MREKGGDFATISEPIPEAPPKGLIVKVYFLTIIAIVFKIIVTSMIGLHAFIIFAFHSLCYRFCTADCVTVIVISGRTE